LDQEDQIRECLDTYGVVVIRDILTPQESEDSLAEIFRIFEVESDRKFKRRDIGTWDCWPSNGIEKYGQPTRTPIFTRQFLMNRQNPNLFKAFTILLGSEDLLVSHDRCCVFRPTKNVEFPDGSYSDMKNWKTGYSVHMDINPYQFMQDTLDEYNERWEQLSYGHKLNNFINENNIGHKSVTHLQGVLNLHDNFEEDGGFCCVPGFSKVFDAWYEGNKNVLSHIKTSPSVAFSSKQHWLNKYVQRIAMRPGSLVIWDSRLPHGSMPNNSSNFRCCQFIKMFYKSDVPTEEILNLRKETVKREVEINRFQNELTPLGTKLFGLEDNIIQNDPKTNTQQNNNADKKRKNDSSNNKRIQGNKW